MNIIQTKSHLITYKNINYHIWIHPDRISIYIESPIGHYCLAGPMEVHPDIEPLCKLFRINNLNLTLQEFVDRACDEAPLYKG